MLKNDLARLRREVFGSPAADDELADLWRQVFGQPPPVVGAPSLLSKVLVQNLPPAPPYTPTSAPAPPAARKRKTGGRG